MPKINIPSEQNWGGINPGRRGILYRTFNIDLDEIGGSVLNTRRTSDPVLTSDPTASGDSDLRTPQTFIRSNADATDRWWAIAHAGFDDTTTAVLWKTSGTSPSIGWAQDALDSSPVDARDMVDFFSDSNADTTATVANAEQRLLITRDTTIAALNDTADNAWNGTWGDDTDIFATSVRLKAGQPHPIARLGKLACIGDRNEIHTVEYVGSNSYSGTRSRLLFPSQFQVRHIFTNASGFWFCCRNLRFDNNGGENTAVMFWDGGSEGFIQYDIQGGVALSGVDYFGIPYVVNDFGIIYRFNGNAFVYDHEFPCREEGLRMVDYNNTFAIAPRGMTLDEDEIILNVGSVSLAATLGSRRMNAGLWSYNPTTRALYQKGSIGQYGTTNTDRGQQRIREPGTIKATNDVSAKFLIGGRYYDAYPTPLLYGIFTLTSITDLANISHGFFETQPLTTEEIQNRWDGIWAKYKGMSDTGSEIILKSRIGESLKNGANNGDRPLEANITWKSTTTFDLTIPDTSTFQGAISCPQVGDEVEILAGDNAGIIAHITAIDDTDGVALPGGVCDDSSGKRITIDETVTASTAASLARFDKWRKLASISDTSSSFKYAPDGSQSDEIRYKVAIRGRFKNSELRELIAQFNQQTASEK